MAYVTIHGAHSLTANLHRIPSVGEHIKIRSPSPSKEHFPDGDMFLVLRVKEVELVEAELSDLNQHADAIVKVDEVSRDNKN